MTVPRRSAEFRAGTAPAESVCPRRRNVPEHRTVQSAPPGEARWQRDVVDDADAVAEPVAPHPQWERLVDRRQPEGLTGVDREPGVIGTHARMRRGAASAVAGLRAGDETDDAASGESHGQFGDLARARGVAHRGDQAAHDDRPTLSGRVLALSEAGQHRLHHLVEVSPSPDAARCEPDLRVHDAVCRQVFDAFARDPFEGGSGLRTATVCANVSRYRSERTAVGGLPEPRRQRLASSAGGSV